MTMAIPDYQELMRPVLLFAADGKEKSTKNAVNHLSHSLDLSEEDRTKLLPSGKQGVLSNRANWAITYLAKAGALLRTKRGHIMISPRGLELLAQPQQHIDNKVLQQFPEFIAFQQSGKKGEVDEAQPGASAQVANVSSTPDEMIISAETLLNQKLKSDLLDRIGSLSPTFFEQLVVDLIVAMGYGGSHGAVAERTQKSGDGGIDGIVNEDPLGLDVVYIQAKRYKDANVIGSPALQQFAGALVGKGANKGVFITTSTFSSGAYQFAEKVPQKIVLIDGEKLAELMMQYDVGVRIERNIAIKKIDLDYFEEIDE